MHDIDEAASCGQHYFKIFMLGYVAHWRCVMYLTDNLYFRVTFGTWPVPRLHRLGAALGAGTGTGFMPAPRAGACAPTYKRVPHRRVLVPASCVFA